MAQKESIMKKEYRAPLAGFAILAFVVVCSVIFLGVRREDFGNTFDVNVSYFMSQEQKDLIQPQVTSGLWRLNHQVVATQAVACKPGEGKCLDGKLIAIGDAEKSLNNAVTYASFFSFDTKIPELCAEGSKPGMDNDGKCADGSMPSW